MAIDFFRLRLGTWIRRRGDLPIPGLARALFLWVLLTALPIAAQETGSLEGSVTDEAGAPIADVRVSLKGASGEWETVTDEAGHFGFTDLATGSYRVLAVHEDFASASATAELSAGSETSLSLRLRLRAVELLNVVGKLLPRQVLEEGPEPIDVIDRAQFEQDGSPAFGELVRNIPQMYGHTSLSNQFTFGSLHQGQRQVSLRGLGGHRNLVLLNGRRGLSNGWPGPQGPAVDIGAFPRIALRRVEILKEPTLVHGSDSITGVFNYITDASFSGLRAEAWFSDIEGMRGGDGTVGVMKGWHRGALHWVTSLEYTERGELRQVDSPWFQERTHRLQDGQWPIGSSIYGNPGGFIGLGAGGVPSGVNVRDPACGTANPTTGADSFPVPGLPFACGFYFTAFDNLVEPQWRLNVLNQFRLGLEDDSEVYGHLLFSKMDVDWKTSPSYPPTNFGATSALYIPPDNPGLRDFVAGLPPEQALGFAAGAIYFGRPRGIIGFGDEGGHAARGVRRSEHWQALAGTRGVWGRNRWLHYDFALTYGKTDAPVTGWDVLTERWGLAHRGLGGPDCDPTTGTPGVAPCYYWNPFYSGWTSDDPELRNRSDVWDWMNGLRALDLEVEQAALYADLSASTGLELPGGSLRYAVGYEVEWLSLSLDLSELARAATPHEPSPFLFLPSNYEIEPGSITQSSHSVYAELVMPVADSVELTVAGRYRLAPWLRDSFTDGQLAVRYAPLDRLVLRGSFSQGRLLPGRLQTDYTQYGQTFVDTLGEFANLELPAANLTTGLRPETADTWNLGLVAHPSRHTSLSLDRWQIQFTDPLLVENVDYVVAHRPEQIEPGANGLPARITIEHYNGPDLDVAGWDFALGIDFFFAGGELSTGVDGSLLDEYQFAASLRTPAYDALGRYNSSDPEVPFELYALPELKFSARIDWRKGRHALSLVHRYVDGYSTHFPPPYDRVESFATQDVFFSYRLPGDQITVKLSAINVGNEPPPLLLHELAYDVTTHSPLGRVLRFGFAVDLPDPGQHARRSPP